MENVSAAGAGPRAVFRRAIAPARAPVELLVIDKGADWEKEGLAAPWRLAEARALAGRLAALIGSEGCPAGEIVVLTRADH